MFWSRKANGVVVVDGMRLKVRKDSVVCPLHLVGTADDYSSSYTTPGPSKPSFTHNASAQGQWLWLSLRFVHVSCCINGLNIKQAFRAASQSVHRLIGLSNGSNRSIALEMIKKLAHQVLRETPILPSLPRIPESASDQLACPWISRCAKLAGNWLAAAARLSETRNRYGVDGDAISGSCKINTLRRYLSASVVQCRDTKLSSRNTWS